MSALSALFSTILNMSITASYAAFAVILVRLLLRKAPKTFSYALWAVVLFRLICPLSFSTAFSFFGLLNINPKNTAGVLEYVPEKIGFMQTPAVQSGIGSFDSAVNSSLPQAVPIASANPMQIWMDVLSIIWLAGMVGLFLYSVLSYIRIKRQLCTATLVKDNIYESDRIGTAFVCGFIQPKIYVPVGVGDADLSYILEHERTHIRRRDYLIKPLAFFALILHWFNPLMWLSFALMSRDMEMACDESVLHKMNQDARGGYSSSLLSLSVKRNGVFAANPLAFGESHVKARIKNVLNYKRPRFWVVAFSIVIVTAVGIGLTADPKSEGIIGSPDGPGVVIAETDFDVESNLAIIMSSPKTSSNPQDYINAHKNEYENFFKYGGEPALQYMLSQFEAGNAEGLRGQIMMRLCKELLGARNNVADESLTPQEWYNALSIRQEIKLPNFRYDGQDPIEALVYATEIEKNSDSNRGGFTVVAPKIFGSYAEADRLKVFVTTFSERYKLFGNVLSVEGGGVVPAAITYRKDDSGGYILEKYEPARDGSEFGPSIREYCTMPVSGKEIKGLADKIFRHYRDYVDIRILLYDNLFDHLKKNGITDATLSNSQGEIKFSMSDPRYKP